MESVAASAVITPRELRRDGLITSEVFAPLLPGEMLGRGQLIACRGRSALSLALALTTPATRAGSWMAVIGIPDLGVDAAKESGLAIERIVAVAVDPDRPQDWADRIAAAADGFDLILTRVPRPRSMRLERLVRQRCRARGVVLVQVGGDEEGADLCLTIADERWEGLGRGSGHLARRRVSVACSGRRVPRSQVIECWLPGRAGSLEPVVVSSPERVISRTA